MINIYTYKFKEDFDLNSEWIPILKTGYIPSKGIEIKREDLENILNAFKNKVRGENLDIPVVSTHQGSEADGWVKDLKIENNTLYANIEFNENGKRKIKEKIYRYVSPEIIFNYTDSKGQKHPAILFRIALTNIPALDLEPLDKVLMEDEGEIMFVGSLDERYYKAREERAEKYGIPIREDGHLIPPKEYAETGAERAEDYADPVNYKYPIHTPENALAALRYFSKPDNHEIYPPKARDIIWERIIKACLKFGISVTYNPEYHKNLPEELKRKMEGYEKEERMEELEEKIKEQEKIILELEEKIKKLEKEKRDNEWKEKVNKLVDNGNITPALAEKLLKLDEMYRDVVYDLFSSIKMVNLSQIPDITTQINYSDAELIKKELEETKELIKKIKGGKR
ncbi:MAG: phage protease [Candidatus Omnitrophica bacterium]|nr:phage protease [Candidatus Omnitrophota bacterium]